MLSRRTQEVGEGDRRLGRQPMRGRHNADERVTTVRLHVERRRVGSPADHAKVPVPLQHTADYLAAIGNLHSAPGRCRGCQGP